ncbi:FAD-dependent 5-carboxymethylaminomethyl-2-thiouridine(34) oxidoreductase MnmC [Ideonella sp. B7]|uniref:FAD-dependent 5-carboxymethylaminomethyl-2-thiouridine(34) oxidoreductase MnmC n=1 Tax=Ideonella benzenivorans TaxID=2831643 RepID=UPI001CEDA6FC|nr:FAD-dependent 5-carboxymethylaminomethyl-2-thiouridine(34) oxidoreductase MnmC [Ideonella benzenivorans]MCA6217860.1 FAD-dependent 5-carboxymethylaminomethyl-2-thiouridine(34) oxidoreductase MnmC [Ideonella benzenivorans]
MKTEPIVEAQIDFAHPGHDGLAWAPGFQDIYHARDGAFAQAEHVFLHGNGLPQRWQGRARFVILETGFGLGNNFLATWAAWRADPQRCARLVFVSMEKHPPRLADLRQAHAHSPAPVLAAQLLAQWPPATPDLHVLDFEDGQVRLLLALGDVATWWPELVGTVDACYLDGFAPSQNPAMWDAHQLRHATRLGAADLTAATWSVSRVVRDGLQGAGLQWERAPGFGTKRDMLIARRHPRPAAALAQQTPPGRQAAPVARQALVIGAGLAGAAAARALAAQGLAVTVLERREAPAQETSGNRAGLFHGVAHAHDGSHAQLLRAAALRAHQLIAPLVARGAVAGDTDGLWRGGGQPADWAARCSALQAQGLPAGYVQAMQPEAAAPLLGVPPSGPGWWYPQGGWACPADLVRAWLATPGVTVHPGQQVQAMSPRHGGGWLARDADGQSLAEADVVVVAGAADGLALLRPWTEVDDWPHQRSRGQVSQLAAPLAEALGLPRPQHPLASGGYLIGLPAASGGGLLCGATHQLHDPDPALRLADHQANLDQLAHLLACPTEHVEPARREALLARAMAEGQLTGRVGWRLACEDRLPLAGPVPLPAAQRAGARRQEQPRMVPRVPGLYVLSALGSRGITLAPLLGEVLAAWITGAPVPLASSLMDAIDPARFIARAARSASRPAQD